jgi:hypothetical protein
VNIEGPLHILASAGETFRVNANVSDPDNDKLSMKWWQFKVGTFPDEVIIANGNTEQCRITIPSTAKGGQTIHLIFEVSDNGKPSITRYQRVWITVREK